MNSAGTITADNPPRQRAPMRTVRSVAGKINGKVKAPGGMEAENGDRQLHR